MRRPLAAIVIGFAAILGCNSESEKGDYILKKEINLDDVPTIAVVHNISKKEASNKSLSFFLENDDPNDVIIYHVTDADLYNELAVGERVTVKTPYTMFTNPPSAIAQEIIRHSEND